MDWHKLYFGKVSPEEVQIAIKNNEWQNTRISMKGKSLETKYRTLLNYLNNNLSGNLDNDRKVKVRVTNYVTALSRGGLIKPSNYR